MIEKIEKAFYDEHWFLLHILTSICVSAIGYFIMRSCNINIKAIYSIINNDTTALSAAMAGFVFAGMSIFISMDGSKKMSLIKSIGKDNIIYNILISSIVFFVVSLLLMLVDINILVFDIEKILFKPEILKSIVEIIALYTLLLGFVFFFSSIKLIYWIFK